MTEAPVAVIGGYGPGLGKGLAEVFSAAGYEVVTISRRGAEFDGALNLAADLSDGVQAKAAIEQVVETFGRIDVYIHNVIAVHIAPFLETSPQEFESVWEAAFLSAVHVTQAVIPHMQRRSSGAILFSGATAAVRGGKNFSAFAASKFALRALSQSLAREFQPAGIHVAHVILDGLMYGTPSVERFGGSKDTSILPGEAAATFLALAQQPSSAWSQEVDIRPSSEGF